MKRPRPAAHFNAVENQYIRSSLWLMFIPSLWLAISSKSGETLSSENAHLLSNMNNDSSSSSNIWCGKFISFQSHFTDSVKCLSSPRVFYSIFESTFEFFSQNILQDCVLAAKAIDNGVVRRRNRTVAPTAMVPIRSHWSVGSIISLIILLCGARNAGYF